MKEFKGDKRTKEYKEWKASFDKENSIGLGDVIEKVTAATHVKKVVEFIAGDDCGCKERKEKLNKHRLKFPLVRCFTEDLYNKWTSFTERNPKEINHKDQELIIDSFNQLFARKISHNHLCCGNANLYIEQINKVYTKY